MSTKPYVKAVESAVPVDKSIGQIKRLVQQFGASGFQTAEDYTRGVITITFVLNPPTGGHVPVQIPVHLDRVYEALYAGKPTRENYRTPAKELKQKRMEQAARTAWRNMHLLVEAALSSVSIGTQTIEEVFMAHTMVALDDGRTARMADYLAQTAGALAPGVRALLSNPSPAPTHG